MQRHLLLLSLTCLLATSCTVYDSTRNLGNPDDGKMTLTIHLDTPPATRLASIDDDAIQNVDILVFDHNEVYRERLRGDLITTNEQTSFTLRLDPDPNPRTLKLIANARHGETDADRINMTTLQPEVSDLHALASLSTVPLTDGSDGSEITPSIMTGEVQLPGGDPTRADLSVTLDRSTAEINLINTGSLVIYGIGVSNAPSGTRPFSTSSTENTGDFIDYGQYDENSWVGSTYRRFYGRTQTPDNQMSVILKAAYDGTIGYYRIVIHDKDGQLLPSLERGHRYTLTIDKVTSPGWPTIEEAKANPPANNTTLWTQFDVSSIHSFGGEEWNHVVSNGKQWMTVTNTAVELWGRSYADHPWKLVDVKSSYPELSTPMLSASHSINDMDVSTRLNGKTSGWFEFTNSNPSAANRSGTMTIYLGEKDAEKMSMDIDVQIIEDKFDNGYVNMVTDAQGNEYYVFLVADETTPKPWKLWWGKTYMDYPSGGGQGFPFSPYPSGPFDLYASSDPISSRVAGKAYVRVEKMNLPHNFVIYRSDGTGKVTVIVLGNQSQVQ